MCIRDRSRLVPKRSAAQPVSGMTVASASVYPVIVQATVAYVALNSAWKVGSATLTTVMSRIDMIAPSTTTPAIFNTPESSLSGIEPVVVVMDSSPVWLVAGNPLQGWGPARRRDAGRVRGSIARQRASVRCAWHRNAAAQSCCLLYTSDAADDLTRVDLGGLRFIKK